MFLKACIYINMAVCVLVMNAHACQCGTMPYGAKQQAICPRGLENQMIQDVFAGFNLEGFDKAATDGEPDLVNGLQRKPWGFYKGFDGINYAVYAFKPNPDHVESVIDSSAVQDNKMLRINIPQYCALYARVPASEDAKSQSSGDKKDSRSKRLRDQDAEDEGQARDTKDGAYAHVGLLISRASMYRPKPLDPGARKTNAVIELMARRFKGEDISSVKPDQRDAQSTQKDELKRTAEGEDADEEGADVFSGMKKDKKPSEDGDASKDADKTDPNASEDADKADNASSKDTSNDNKDDADLKRPDDFEGSDDVEKRRNDDLDEPEDDAGGSSVRLASDRGQKDGGKSSTDNLSDEDSKAVSEALEDDL